MVRRFGVTSSPSRPSPRVAPRVKTPFSYRSATPRPSTLGSQTYVNATPGSTRLIRASNSRRSASLVAFSSDSIGARCATVAKASAICPATRCVGESAVTSSGCRDSSSRSSRTSASYSASVASGRSSA